MAASATDSTNAVSIPHWFDSKLVIPSGRVRHNGGFNSTLVRFKDFIQLVEVNEDQYRFNSTLVRFKEVLNLEDNIYQDAVSIPHWFDSKQSIDLLRLNEGSSFNSTLVRFKVTLVRLLPVYTKRFQFHIGSIQR